MKKKLSIALLAFSLAMLCASFAVRQVGNIFKPLFETENVEEDFSPFGVIKTTGTKNIEFPVTRNQEQNFEFQEKKEILKPVLQFEVTEEEKRAIGSYSQNPKLRAFVEDLSKVISQEEIDQENYLKIAFKPEVRAIFEQYSKDQEFREIAETIMKDKNLLQLAKKVINDKENQK